MRTEKLNEMQKKLDEYEKHPKPWELAKQVCRTCTLHVTLTHPYLYPFKAQKRVHELEKELSQLKIDTEARIPTRPNP